MIYTKQTKMAMKLCYEAHAGQVDKSGIPYVFHPIHLAEQMDDEISTVVALLHDVVEDTPYTFADLEAMGFGQEVIEALKLLTHDDGRPYQEYVENLAEHPVARKVKLADLEHNMDLTRLNGEPTMKDQQRILKYLNAYMILEREEKWTMEHQKNVHAALTRQKERRILDQIRGSLIAGAAGDALGYEVEFVTGDWILNQFGQGGIRSYVKHDGLARISDDTQMTMYTAVGLLYGLSQKLHRGTAIPMENAIYLAYLDWLETQGGGKNKYRVSWLNNIGDLYSRRAPGNTCLSALRSGEKGSVAEPINHSKGCGGVMRVAPIGLFFRNDGAGETDRIRQIMSLGAEAAAITHGHPLGYISAAALVHIVNRIVWSGCKYGNQPGDILAECKELLTELYGDTGYAGRMNDLLDQAAMLAGNDKPDMENIHAIGGGWVGEEALAIAVYCWLRYPDEFDRALIASVNHSGDSDSTGAILGNILGAQVGYQAIGDKWKKDLEFHNLLLELADDLHNGCALDNGGEGNPLWLDKYVHHSYTPVCIHG